MPGGRDGIPCVCLRRAATTDFLGCRFRDRPPTTRQRMRPPTIWRRMPAIRPPCPNRGQSRQTVQGRRSIRGGLCEHTLLADNVIVATGAYNNPRIPPFARDSTRASSNSTPRTTATHPNSAKGSARSGRGQLRRGDSHRNRSPPPDVVVRPDTGQEPTRAGSRMDLLLTPVLWFMATRFTVNTPPGRKIRDHFLDPPRGIPLGRVRRKDIAAAGIERVENDGCEERLSGARGRNCLGRIQRHLVHRIHPRLRLDRSSLPTHNGVPVHVRGIVESCPGLYFMGLLFLSR